MTETLYYVIQCCHSSESRGSNQRGKPCGKWGIIQRRSPVGWNRPQIRCPQKDCTHRLRVNPANTHGPYHTKHDAETALTHIENRLDAKGEDAKARGALYYVYQCTSTNETRGGGYGDSGKHCGSWNVLRRSMPIPDDAPGRRRVQAKCSKCGNRPRLYPGNVIGPYLDQGTAFKMRDNARVMNSYEVDRDEVDRVSSEPIPYCLGEVVSRTTGLSDAMKRVASLPVEPKTAALMVSLIEILMEEVA